MRPDRDVDYLSFWGKAKFADPGNCPGWHPLAYHSLDVAAAGEALLAAHGGLRGRFCGLFGLPDSKTVALLRFLICLHDIGKFAGRFQAKAPELFPNCLGVDASALSSRFDHGNWAVCACSWNTRRFWVRRIGGKPGAGSRSSLRLPAITVHHRI